MLKVIQGKSSKVDEWLQFLNDTMVTLDGEKITEDEEYLYWYSVRDERFRTSD